jgi:hypothetical protein
VAACFEPPVRSASGASGAGLGGRWAAAVGGGEGRGGGWGRGQGRGGARGGERGRRKPRRRERRPRARPRERETRERDVSEKGERRDKVEERFKIKNITS